MVGSVPWQTSLDQDSTEVLNAHHIGDPRQVPAPPMVDFSARVYLRSKDVEKFGATPGCWGCRAVMSGATAAGHSEACRARITSKMTNDDCDRERVEIAEKRRCVLKDEPARRTGEKRLRSQRPRVSRMTNRRALLGLHRLGLQVTTWYIRWMRLRRRSASVK